MTYAERKTAFIANRNNMTAAECDAERNALNALFHVEQNAKVDADFLAGVEVDTTTFLDMLKRYGQAPMQGWFQHAVQGVSAEGYSTYKLTSAQTKALTEATALLVSAMREPTDATTVQQVPAQSVYTLELAVGDDVASKEYRDYTRAKQAYNDAISDELASMMLGVTRVELFSEAVGSMDKWVCKEPALASANVVHTMDQLKNEASSQYAKRVAAVEHSAELQEALDAEAANHAATLAEVQRLHNELSKARELLVHMLKDDDMPVHWFAQRIDDFLSNQSAPDDKDVQP